MKVTISIKDAYKDKFLKNGKLEFEIKENVAPEILYKKAEKQANKRRKLVLDNN